MEERSISTESELSTWEQFKIFWERIGGKEKDLKYLLSRGDWLGKKYLNSIREEKRKELTSYPWKTISCGGADLDEVYGKFTEKGNVILPEASRMLDTMRNLPSQDDLEEALIVRMQAFDLIWELPIKAFELFGKVKSCGDFTEACTVLLLGLQYRPDEEEKYLFPIHEDIEDKEGSQWAFILHYRHGRWELNGRKLHSEVKIPLFYPIAFSLKK